MELWLWFKAVLKYWWALMSCAIFTAIGVYAAHANKNNEWIVQTSFVAAGVCAVIACFLAWRDKHRTLEEFETKYLHECPRLGLEVNSLEGERTWVENSNPVTITIKHLSGRVPSSLHFEPIRSKRGKYILQFDALPHVEPLQPKPMPFDVIEVGRPELSARDREITHVYLKDMLLLFLSDSIGIPHLGEMVYPLVARFSDNNETQLQTFNLRWNWDKHGFMRDTT